MFHPISVLVLIVLSGTIPLFKCNNESTNENENDFKVILNAPYDIVHPHPEIRPTTPQNEFLPGVPPSLGQTGSRPTPKPTHSNLNLNVPMGPFGWIFQWFQSSLNPRDLPSNDTNFEALEFSKLNHTQTAQIYELIEMGQRNNNTSEFEQMVQHNKGIFDWLLEITGFANKPNGNGNNKPQKTCSSCKCGESFKQIRIVGGVETRVNAYPWMAYLKYSGRFYCGATVINNKYLLTAAHCVNGFNKTRLEVTLLDHDRSTSSDSTTMTYKVGNVYRHTRYNQGGSYNNDLALLKLNEELNFNGLLKPVCLPPVGKSFTGYMGIATGWGATQEHGQISNRLREVSVPIFSNANCRKTAYGNKITDNMLCAGFPDGKKDSCQGDSGGPLHVANGSVHYIVGIVSWGEGCAEANYPGVYTRVNRYSSWIAANTKDACYCS